jgi:hypothetical protein
MASDGRKGQASDRKESCCAERVLVPRKKKDTTT